MKRLLFINNVPNQFSEHKDYIQEVLNDFFDFLDLDCELKIEFIDFLNENEYEHTDCILVNSSIKNHKILITNFVLNSINKDGGIYFNLTIYHEFEHIRDYVNMMQTKLFKFNLCLALQKDFERQYISTGFLFWTEIYAYYKTIRYSKQNNFSFEKITFGNLVKHYKKTDECNKTLFYKKDLTYDEAAKYINIVDSFVYLCAKFMASAYANNSRIPHKKINNNKFYKKVYLILSGFEPKVKRLFNNPYSQKSYNNLLILGKYICENLRWKIFKVGLIKKDGKVHSFY